MIIRRGIQFKSRQKNIVCGLLKTMHHSTLLTIQDSDWQYLQNKLLAIEQRPDLFEFQQLYLKKERFFTMALLKNRLGPLLDGCMNYIKDDIKVISELTEPLKEFSDQVKRVQYSRQTHSFITKSKLIRNKLSSMGVILAQRQLKIHLLYADLQIQPQLQQLLDNQKIHLQSLFSLSKSSLILLLTQCFQDVTSLMENIPLEQGCHWQLVDYQNYFVFHGTSFQLASFKQRLMAQTQKRILIDLINCNNQRLTCFDQLPILVKRIKAFNPIKLQLNNDFVEQSQCKILQVPNIIQKFLKIFNKNTKPLMFQVSAQRCFKTQIMMKKQYMLSNAHIFPIIFKCKDYIARQSGQKFKGKFWIVKQKSKIMDLLEGSRVPARVSLSQPEKQNKDAEYLVVKSKSDNVITKAQDEIVPLYLMRLSHNIM